MHVGVSTTKILANNNSSEIDPTSVTPKPTTVPVWLTMYLKNKHKTNMIGTQLATLLLSVHNSTRKCQYATSGNTVTTSVYLLRRLWFVTFVFER